MQIDVNGRTTYCHTGGVPLDAALPTVVLVHGALNDHSVWLSQSNALARSGLAVLAPDLPGHGRSSGPALTSVEALADWLLALLDAANIDRAVLAGHSMGSLIALEAAHRAPGRVTGLALLGATWPMKVADGLLASARSDERAAIDMVVAWSHATMAHDPSIADTARTLMLDLAAGNPDHLLYTDLAACNAYANGAAAAATITCPTVFVQGNLDKMTPPRSTGLLTGAISHGQVVKVDAGHAMMREAPAAVLDVLQRFAADLNSRRGQ
jgi:pimeloyl-ACP methyl ester carboxylesterase